MMSTRGWPDAHLEAEYTEARKEVEDLIKSEDVAGARKALSKFTTTWGKATTEDAAYLKAEIAKIKPTAK